MNAKYCPEIKSRWQTYSTYKFILWAWMMNEVALVFLPVDMSHNGLYIHAVLHAVAAIFIGIPLVYSEICLAQYTNYNVIKIWNFFPIFRSVGYGTIYLTILKTIYMTVLMTWYFLYSLYAALDPPPWYSCDDFGDEKCMVKRVNVSIFQHCLEAQNLFDDDCGMKTASSCFFDREIGNNNTMNTNCFHIWKLIGISCALGGALFLISIKVDRCLNVIAKVLAMYTCVLLFVLFCVAMASSGTWYSTKISMNWSSFTYKHCFYTLTRGVLSCGTGCGIIGFLSRDVSFRSPATMTSITTTLLSVLVSVILGLVIFSGIKTMSYFHGEEQNVLEIGDSLFFNSFASVSEIISYFDSTSIWGFLWFLTIFLCIFVNLWLLILFLHDFVLTFIQKTQQHYKFSLGVIISLACIISCPFYCSDITETLLDVTEIIQITNSLFFSFSLYWIYGYRKHTVDIIFMIGVKASYFWKLAWIVNPVLLSFILYMKIAHFYIKYDTSSYVISSIDMRVDLLLGYIWLSIYIFILLVGIYLELRKYGKEKQLLRIFVPCEDWGPQESTLFRSRNMFVPEIMTREFLYRQVRIRGYGRKKTVQQKENEGNKIVDPPNEAKWSAFNSN